MAVDRPLAWLWREARGELPFKSRPAEDLLFSVQALFWGSVQMLWRGYLSKVDRERYLGGLESFILAGLQCHPQDDRSLSGSAALPSDSDPESER